MLTKMVNGERFEMSPTEEADIRAQWAAADAARQLYIDEEQYKDDRLKAYPRITDQLDAVLKQFNLMRLNGDNMVSDMDTILGQWLQVKQDIPKPTEIK